MAFQAAAARFDSVNPLQIGPFSSDVEHLICNEKREDSSTSVGTRMTTNPPNVYAARQDQLSQMLADWHEWSKHTASRSGLPGKAAGFGSSRSNSQYDWSNNIESDLVDKRIMQGFDQAVNRIPQPWHTALQFEARACAYGSTAWSSPRIPHNKDEREAMVLLARNKLLKELERDGVLCA